MDVEFPVIFATRAKAAGKNDVFAHFSFVMINYFDVDKETKEKRLLVSEIPYLSALLQEMELAVDDIVILQIVKLVLDAGILSDSSTNKSIDDSKRALTSIVKIRSLEDIAALTATEGNAESDTYIGVLHLHPIALNLTFRQTHSGRIVFDGSSSGNKSSDMDEKISTLTEKLEFADDSSEEVQLIMNVMKQVVGGVMPSVTDARLRLSALMLEKSLVNEKELVRRISKYFIQQGVRQAYKVIGAIGVLGAPLKFAMGVGSGVKDFFYEPAAGIVTSPKDFAKGLGKGTLSLFGSSVSSTFQATGSVTSTIGNGIAMLQEKLARDKRYADSRRRARRDVAMNVQQGLSRGALRFGKGLLTGLTGIFTEPIAGVKSGGGAKGFLAGVGRGLLGILVKPTAGVLDGVAKASEGVKNASSSASKRSVLLRRGRLRPPRVFAEDGALIPYSRHEAEGQQLLTTLPKLKDYRYETYVYHAAQEGRVVLLTHRTVLCLTRSGSLDWARPLDALCGLDSFRSIVRFHFPKKHEKKGTKRNETIEFLSFECENEDESRSIEGDLILLLES